MNYKHPIKQDLDYLVINAVAINIIYNIIEFDIYGTWRYWIQMVYNFLFTYLETTQII